jgi:predicted permease
MESWIQDFRYSIRVLAKERGFTLVALLTLALGIGANTAIFSAIDAVLLKPLPYRDPGRLMAISEKPPAFPRNSVSAATFLDWKNQNHVFEQVAGRESTKFNLLKPKGAEEIPGARVSPNYFQLLGIQPALGRTFLNGEDTDGKDNVAVLTNLEWRRTFGSRREIIGEAITLDGRKFTVVGILPAESIFDRGLPQIFVPLTFPANPSRSSHFLAVYGRLKPGFTKEQAQSEMDVIASGISERFPETNKGWGVALDFLNDVSVTPNTRQSLLVLGGAVVLVLLIACANLANLTLAKVTGRQREISIRAALGAGRLRIVRQFLTECVILSIAGGLLGISIGYWLVTAFSLLIPRSLLPAAAHLRVDDRVLIFALMISVLTGLIFGVVPAWQASKTNISGSLQDVGRSATASLGRRFLGSMIVISEVALSIVLLIGSFLLMRSLSKLQSADVGFKPEGLLSMQVNLRQSKYKTEEQAIAFYSAAINELARLPGVRSVGLATDLPIAGWSFGVPFNLPSHAVADAAKRPFAHYQAVNKDYFNAVGIPLLEGRTFTDADRRDSQRVAIVNQTLAHVFFAGEDAVGKIITVGDEATPTLIVGITGDVKLYSPADLESNHNVEIYCPYTQAPSLTSYLAVRSNGDPSSLVSSVRTALMSVDKNQPVIGIRTMKEALSESLSSQLFDTVLLGIFAAIAMLLSAIGLYGIISYTVAQQTRDIGVRLALGAQKRDVLGMVISHGMGLIGLGTAIGLGAAIILTRTLSSLLYKVSATDPLSFIATPVTLAAIALVACYISLPNGPQKSIQ